MRRYRLMACRFSLLLLPALAVFSQRDLSTGQRVELGGASLYLKCGQGCPCKSNGGARSRV